MEYGILMVISYPRPTELLLPTTTRAVINSSMMMIPLTPEAILHLLIHGLLAIKNGPRGCTAREYDDGIRLCTEGATKG